MEINWLGESALLLKGREVKVLVDPGYAGEGTPMGASEIVVGAGVGQNRLRPPSGPQMVARPGEYELGGVAVHGVATEGGTVFVTEVDEVAVCDFGELPAEVDAQVVDALGVIDVLAVSLQQGSQPRAREVAHLVSQLQPAVLVPVGYRASEDGSPGELAPLAKEMGLSAINPQAKLSLTGSGGASEDTRVVVLEARH